MTTLRQIEANRRNLERSTGPTSDSGKCQSRRNAVKHGLTSQTILADDVEARRFLRYHSESRTAFQRAFAQLVKTLESDEAEAGTTDIPDELSVACEAIETAQVVSPNEANLAPRDEPVSDATPVSTADSVVIRLPEPRPSKRARKARQRAARASSRRAAGHARKEQGVTVCILGPDLPRAGEGIDKGIEPGFWSGFEEVVHEALGVGREGADRVDELDAG